MVVGRAFRLVLLSTSSYRRNELELFEDPELLEDPELFEDNIRILIDVETLID